MRVLVTGIAGQLGQLVARQLLKDHHTVAGLDLRPWPDRPKAVDLYELDIRKRAAEDVFRRFKPEGVIHMATVTHLAESSDARYRINLSGTRAVFDHSHTYGIKKVVFVGRHTYYGAGPASPLYHLEDEPPMVMNHFPELADLVAADLYAGSALWRFPKLNTAVLRLCYTLGPARHGTLASFLRGPRVPTILGWDPLYQFMHERDAASAIATALGADLRGVYNVSGPPPLPLSVIIRETGRRWTPVPESVFAFALKRLKLPNLPRGALDHIKFPILVDSKAFRDATGFEAEYNEDETLASFRYA